MSEDKEVKGERIPSTEGNLKGKRGEYHRSKGVQLRSSIESYP